MELFKHKVSTLNKDKYPSLVLRKDFIIEYFYALNWHFKKTMKQIITFPIIILSLSLSFCTGRGGKDKQMTYEDSVSVKSDRAFQVRLSELQKVRRDLVGPTMQGDASVAKGAKFSTNLLGDSIDEITGGFEKLNAKLEQAQKDSSTAYGALLTRFRLLNTQHKYITATYTSGARLLRFTSEITFDDRHEEDRDYYFSNDSLVYLRVRHTFTQNEQDVMTDDSYFIKNCTVEYSYRDQGSAPERKNKMDVIPMTRYYIKGNVTAQVSKEFEEFKHDYEILLSRSLEPLIYPDEPDVE